MKENLKKIENMLKDITIDNIKEFSEQKEKNKLFENETCSWLIDEKNILLMSLSFEDLTNLNKCNDYCYLNLNHLENYDLDILKTIEEIIGE